MKCRDLFSMISFKIRISSAVLKGLTGHMVANIRSIVQLILGVMLEMECRYAMHGQSPKYYLLQNK